MASSLVGPVNNKRKKADLVEIASALGLDPVGTVNELVGHIKKHLKGNEQLSTDPQFQGLYVYRPGAAGAAIPTKSTKNSADKSAEDVIEGEKPRGDATG